MLPGFFIMFKENLDVFLSDFGVPVAFGEIRGTGIFDSPTVNVLEYGRSDDYSLLVKSSLFSTLETGSRIYVNGAYYVVRETFLEDDGAFLRVNMAKE